MSSNRNDVSYAPGNFPLLFHKITDMSVSHNPAVCLAGVPEKWSLSDSPAQWRLSTLSLLYRSGKIRVQLFLFLLFKVPHLQACLVSPSMSPGCCCSAVLQSAAFLDPQLVAWYWHKRSVQSRAIALCWGNELLRQRDGWSHEPSSV